MNSSNSDQSDLANSDLKPCPRCGTIVNHALCRCGDDVLFHNLTHAHTFVPIGCRCHDNYKPTSHADDIKGLRDGIEKLQQELSDTKKQLEKRNCVEVSEKALVEEIACLKIRLRKAHDEGRRYLHKLFLARKEIERLLGRSNKHTA